MKYLNFIIIFLSPFFCIAQCQLCNQPAYHNSEPERNELLQEKCKLICELERLNLRQDIILGEVSQYVRVNNQPKNGLFISQKQLQTYIDTVLSLQKQCNSLVAQLDEANQKIQSQAIEITQQRQENNELKITIKKIEERNNSLILSLNNALKDKEIERGLKEKERRMKVLRQIELVQTARKDILNETFIANKEGIPLEKNKEAIKTEEISIGYDSTLSYIPTIRLKNHISKKQFNDFSLHIGNTYCINDSASKIINEKAILIDVTYPSGKFFPGSARTPRKEDGGVSNYIYYYSDVEYCLDVLKGLEIGNYNIQFRFEDSEPFLNFIITLE